MTHLTHDRRVPRRRSSITPAVASVLAMAAVGMTAGSAAAADWSPVAPVPTAGTGGISTLAVAARPDARSAIAVWSKLAGGAPRVYASELSTAGTWSAAPTPLSSPIGRAADSPTIAAGPGGRYVAAWRQFDGAGFRIYAALKAPGKAWATPAPITPTTVDPSEPHVVIDTKGNADVVWVEHAGSIDRIAAATLPVGGSWTPEVALSSSASSAQLPALSVGASGQVRAAWIRQATTGFTLETASHLRGQPWGSATSLGTTDAAARPAVTVDPKDVNTVAFLSGQQIVVTRRAPGGTWSAPVRLLTAAEAPAGAAASSAPSAVVKPDGGVVVGWQQRTTNADGIAVYNTAISTLAAGHWTTKTDGDGRGDFRYRGGEPLLTVDGAGNVSYLFIGYDHSEPALPWQQSLYVKTDFANGTTGTGFETLTGADLRPVAISGGPAGFAVTLLRNGSDAQQYPPAEHPLPTTLEAAYLQ